MPAGATVLFGEWGQYNDMFRGLCGNAPGNPDSFGNSVCQNFIPTGVVGSGPAKGVALVTNSIITGSEVDRWGIGFVQEIDSAAMHVFARWQHLELNSLTAKNLELPASARLTQPRQTAPPTATSAKTSAADSKISISSRLAA